MTRRINYNRTESCQRLCSSSHVFFGDLDKQVICLNTRGRTYKHCLNVVLPLRLYSQRITEDSYASLVIRSPPFAVPSFKSYSVQPIVDH